MPSIQIDMTVAQANRLADAWEELYGVRPTIPMVKTHLILELKALVSHGERAKAEREAQAPASFDPS